MIKVYTPDDYQKQAARTSPPEFELRGNIIKVGSRNPKLLLSALGIAGEAGEIVELIKKHAFHNGPLDRTALRDELGDLLWYVATLCDALNVDLSTVMIDNLLKLGKRFPSGWSPEDAAAKADRFAPEDSLEDP